MPRSLVLIVGAGLAGLAAARDSERRGYRVIVFEARERIGGRVWTARNGLGGMHGELGGELIDEDQHEIRKLASELGLRESRVLWTGFSHYRLGNDGRRRMRTPSTGWRQMGRMLEALVRAYTLNGEQWDGPIAAALARQSLADWLDGAGNRRKGPGVRGPTNQITTDVRATVTTMRNFFVADPDELSLLVYVEQFAAGDDPARRVMYRLRDGNDRLLQRMADALRTAVRVHHIVRRIVQTRDGVRLTVENRRGRQTEVEGDYAVVTVPAPLAAEIDFSPALPEAQRDAFARLRYGRATKTLLQFEYRPWKRSGRPRACATDLDVGAVWDASEDQPGRRGLLSLLAGGSASNATKAILVTGGLQTLAARLRFFGIGSARPIAFRSVSWEDDPWARGAYAFYDPTFPPASRRLLAVPWKRVLFAGEHTSTRWQGYMNGAIESGLRAVEEMSAIQELRGHF